jgi:hypothetical protein
MIQRTFYSNQGSSLAVANCREIDFLQKHAAASNIRAAEAEVDSAAYSIDTYRNWSTPLHDLYKDVIPIHRVICHSI